MKKEKGSVATKIIIIVIILLIALGVGLIILSKSGKINLQIGKSNESQKNYSDAMEYREKEDNNYVFIDTAGNLIKLSEDILGKDFDGDMGEKFYKNSILATRDGKEYIVNFNGDTVYGPADIDLLAKTENYVLYEIYQDGKYGVIDASGNILLPAEYENVRSDIPNCFYTYDYNEDRTGESYITTIYNVNGEKIFESDSDSSSLWGTDYAETLNGVYVILFEKNDNTQMLVNMNNGDILQTFTLSENESIKLDNQGSAIEVKLTNYSDTNSSQELYFWFGEDGKVSKKMEDAGKYYSWGNTDKSTMVLVDENDINNKYSFIIDKFGKEIYKTPNHITQYQYTNEKTGEMHNFYVEEIDRRKYKTLNIEGKTIMENSISYVGNNYLYGNNVLYKFDGTKYMEDIKKYVSVYDLNIITTKDKVIIENSEGKKIEKEADFSLGDNHYLLDNDTAVFKSDKNIIIINMNDLSIKTIDTSAYKYSFVKDGYYALENDSNQYEYYNKNGELICKLEG